MRGRRWEGDEKGEKGEAKGSSERKKEQRRARNLKMIGRSWDGDEKGEKREAKVIVERKKDQRRAGKERK
jgi:hypothetical protein